MVPRKRPEEIVEDDEGSLQINLGIMKLDLKGNSVQKLTPWIGAVLLIIGVAVSVCAVIAAWGRVAQ